MRTRWDYLPEPGAGLRPLLTGFLKLLVRPPVVGWFILVLTIDYWTPLAAYLLLRTCLFGVGFLLVWIWAIFALIAFLGGFGYFIAESAKLRPIVRDFKAAKLAGDDEGVRRNLGRWRARNRNIHTAIFAVMLSTLVIPSVALALVLGGGSAYLVRDHGKLRYATHNEEIRNTLRWMERRGLLTPFKRD